MSNSDIFESSFEYPDPEARRRLASLTGIEDQKKRLEKGLRLILDPSAIERWSETHHQQKLPLITHFQARPPLFILAGDVGTGKTALAESIGDSVARSEDIAVTLHRMSLSSRGSGLVGEMTKLVTAAFAEVAEQARKAKPAKGKARAGHILLIDEADALAQSRENNQMHHEDRAGVNALIRGINELAGDKLPAAVIMCTNRIDAIDPAIQRRAAEVLSFGRPGSAERHAIISGGLQGTGISAQGIKALVEATGEVDGRPPFTFSDITQRLLPNIALDAYPDKPITLGRALAIAQEMQSSPAFGGAR